ncbi:pyridoxal-phosphate dependent enzyme [Aestuariibacter halophilus]|uniref:Pyridoxal-phosphate dependent enzyme n=1 Tax=Fluctibacter halophilus TaxID=226011 RepID=A0ABS8GCL9_9ALTE|nr:pyridoxal-phosphate dependent enzyme [Aestuariibacter halophilus]MCC2618305.1 pyridoxal-phosphate dependent enzyme [Aestuariibacter halophilus]
MGLNNQHYHELADALGIVTPSPCQPFSPDWDGAERVRLYVKRDDLIHPIISGNKWRKLWPVLAHAQRHNIRHIVSFGGAHSNHLHALAFACHRLGITLTAAVRGYENAPVTPTLEDLARWGAQVQFYDKVKYRYQQQPEGLADLQRHYPNALFLAQGGATTDGLEGLAPLWEEFDTPPDVLLLPIGSGMTLAGLLASRQQRHTRLIGVAALQGQDYLESLVNDLYNSANQSAHWHIDHRFHCGGFAKSAPALRQLCEQLNRDTGIPVEPVYSGKVVLALKTLLVERAFAPQASVVWLHTGGLQGARAQSRQGLQI